MVNNAAVNLEIQKEEELLLVALTVPDAQTVGHFNFSSPELDTEKLTLRF